MSFEANTVYVVVEFLAKSKGLVNQQAVLDEIPFEPRSVTGVLLALYACGFVERKLPLGISGVAKDADYLFGITKNISAYQIIKLGEMGIDMNSLGGLVKISDKQKQAAMALTTQSEKLMEMDGQARAKRAEAASKSSPKKPLPRDAIVDTLERLALASELSIKEVGGVKGNEDLLKALHDAKDQAMKALVKYQHQLQSGGADHAGF